MSVGKASLIERIRGYKGIIIGRPLIDLDEIPPSYYHVLSETHKNPMVEDMLPKMPESMSLGRSKMLSEAAREYYRTGYVVEHIQYLLSETPISEMFWNLGAYKELYFEYKGRKISLITNHGSHRCMQAVIQGDLNISDWVLDLFHLSPAQLDKGTYQAFKTEVQKQVKNGIKKYLIK